MTSVTAGDGEEVAIYEYDSFGNVLTEAGSLANEFKFSTKQADKRGQLIDFGFRWYDPEVGRFTQRDPIGVGGGLNVYAYCAGNPVNFVDPWGLDPILPPPGCPYQISPGPNPQGGSQSDSAPGEGFAGDETILLVITDDTTKWDKFWWNVLGGFAGVDFISANVGDVAGVIKSARNAYNVFGKLDAIYISSHGLGQFDPDVKGKGFWEITRSQGKELSQYCKRDAEIRFFGCCDDDDVELYRRRAWGIHDVTGLSVCFHTGLQDPGPRVDPTGVWITVPWW